MVPKEKESIYYLEKQPVLNPPFLGKDYNLIAQSILDQVNVGERETHVSIVGDIGLHGHELICVVPRVSEGSVH